MENQRDLTSADFDDCIVRERIVNFSKEEVDKLEALVNKFRSIIMCPKTDSATQRQKDLAWTRIRREFNATGDVLRTTRQLQYKFEYMKKNARKEAAKGRQEIKRTSGCQPLIVDPRPEAVLELRSMMSLIKANDTINDMVAAAQKSESTEETTAETTVEQTDSPTIDTGLELPPSQSSVMPPSALSQSSVMPPSALSQSSVMPPRALSQSSVMPPRALPFRRQILQRQTLNQRFVRTALREQLLEIENMKQRIKNEEKRHQQAMQYNEEKHKLELEKLKLEIELLKAKLSVDS